MPLKTPKAACQPKAYHRAPKQEKEVAKRLGGKQTVASGSKHEKGDVRLKGIARIECKTTQKDSFRVTKKMLQQLEDCAISAGEMPVLVIEFLNQTGKPEGTLCVVPQYFLDSLVQTQNPK